MLKKILFSIFFISILVIGIHDARSSSSGAPDGFTGSPGDGQICVLCHQGPTPTAISGAITSNVPVTGYVPGNTYAITAQISRVGHNRFGFQISPQDNFANALGVLTDITTETQVTGSGTYITHTTSGTYGTDSKTWIFDWTAPNAGTGNVTFYGAFNATNNNGSNNGDTIFSSMITIPEDISTTTDAANRQNNFFSIYPNPAAEEIRLTFFSNEETKLNVFIYDLEGVKVFEWPQTIFPNSCINKKFQLPENISSGIYLLKVETEQKSFIHKLIINKS